MYLGKLPPKQPTVPSGPVCVNPIDFAKNSKLFSSLGIRIVGGAPNLPGYQQAGAAYLSPEAAQYYAAPTTPGTPGGYVGKAALVR